MLFHHRPRRLAIGRYRREFERRGGQYREAFLQLAVEQKRNILRDASNLHDSSTVIGDSLAAILINHQKVTAVGTQSGLDGSLNSETGIDVGDDLSLTLRSIGSCKKFYRQ